MNQYMDFISQIPDEILQKTDIHLCSNIAIFKPRAYIVGIPLEANDYHIMLPSENLPDMYFNQKLIHDEKRKILAVNPGDIAYCTKDAPTRPYYSLLIRSSFLHKIAEEMDYYDTIKFVDCLNPFSSELLQAIKSFDREASRPDQLQMMLDCLEVQIAALLLREFKTNLKRYPQNLPDIDSYVRMAIEYMRTYFSSSITIEDICGEIHVSPFHFIRKFKQKTGLSPHRFLLNMRIEKAQELLRTGKYSVSETAMLCGFVSVPHFYAVFKENTGYSPGDYKKR